MDKPLKKREQFNGKFDALPSTFQATFRMFDTGVRVDYTKLGIASVGVFWLGFYEAALRSKGAPNYWFCTKYGLHNILPSVVASTKDPVLVARSMGLDPETILRDLGEKTTRRAHRAMKIQTLVTLRAIAAGFAGVAQVLAVAASSIEAARSYQERVRGGREPFLKGVQERVVRLGGADSGATRHSLARFGPHVVPVHEDAAARGAAAPSLRAATRGDLVPSWWCVPGGRYGDEGAFEGFRVPRDWLLAGKDGQRLLVVEADASPRGWGGAAAAAAAPAPRALRPQDAALAFRAIWSLATRDKTLQEGDLYARVIIMDTRARAATGGGAPATARAAMEARAGADVYVDARAPLHRAVVEWARGARRQARAPPPAGAKVAAPAKGGKKAPCRVVVDVDCPATFRELSEVLSRAGFEPVDVPPRDDTRRGKAAAAEAEGGAPLLWVAQRETSAHTADHVCGLVEAGRVPGERLCALLDGPEGPGSPPLRRAEELAGCRIEYVCAAHIYDSVFSNIRVWLRDGYSPAKIQTFLDQTWNREL